MTLNARLITLSIAAMLAGCAIDGRISYQQDVYPTLASNCLACHARPLGVGYQKGGLDLSSYQSLMQGTLYGPVIIPGDSRTSVLNMLVEGRAEDCMNRQHDEGYALTAREIEILRLWVDQGAKNN